MALKITESARLKEKTMNRRNFVLMISGLTAGLATQALGSADMLLRVDGDIRGAGGVSFTDADLLKFKQKSFATSTVWTEGVHQFSGPSLQLLLDKLGAGPGNLRLTAVNDYSVEVNRSLVTADAPIIANRIDNKIFDRRAKGPLWVMFPFDALPDLQNEAVFAACAWQLSRITVLKG